MQGISGINRLALKLGYLFLSFQVLIFSFSGVAARAQQQVSVGLTESQPPFVTDSAKSKGLVFDLIDAMNEFQNDYLFVAKIMPTIRLLARFDDHGQELIAFNDIHWGWADRGAQGSLTLTNGEDLFFRLKEKPTPQETPEIVAVKGYHYAFADFDHKKLQELPNVSLTKDEPLVMKMVLSNRGDVGIASNAFLSWMRKINPEEMDRVTILPDPDHRYHRQFIVLPQSKVSVEALDRLFTEMETKGLLSALFANYGLASPPLEPHDGQLH